MKVIDLLDIQALAFSQCEEIDVDRLVTTIDQCHGFKLYELQNDPRGALVLIRIKK